MSDTRTLFIQFDAREWTQEALDSLMEVIEEKTADDVEAVAVSDDIEFMDEEQVESFGNELLDSLPDA